MGKLSDMKNSGMMVTVSSWSTSAMGGKGLSKRKSELNHNFSFVSLKNVFL
jgi:hypothetical protein